MLNKPKENYASAILIAYRLYCKFIGKMDFNKFEPIVNNDYSFLAYEIEKRNKKGGEKK